MSVAKHQDALLVKAMLREAVTWWHEAKEHPDNEATPLSDLARQCANGVFQNFVGAIPEQRREIVAKKFMSACRERFTVEVQQALTTPEVLEVAH